MDKILKTSLKFIEKINYKKYGWVLTTASIVALIFLQKGKDDHDDQKSKKDSSNTKEETNKKSEQKGSNKDDKNKSQNKINSKEAEELSKQNANKQLSSSQGKSGAPANLKEQKMHQISQNLKKQMQEIEKKAKKSNSGSLNGSNLRNSKGRYGSKQFEEEQNMNQNAQLYAMSDIEARQNLQIKYQVNIKKQKKYVTDIDEPANSYKRNQILKIAKDQNANDNLFFQVLASLAENDEEYE